MKHSNAILQNRLAFCYPFGLKKNLWRSLVVKRTLCTDHVLLDYLAAGDPLDPFLDHFPTVKREQAVALLDELKDSFDAAA